jgi:glucokinase
MILACDLGGSKCNLALVQKQNNAFRVLRKQRYASRAFPGLGDMVGAFLEEVRAILASSPSGCLTAAGFGVAGPVIGGAARLTNLGWVLESSSLAKQLGLPQVALLNDLEATGYGLPCLQDDHVHVLNSGVRKPGEAQALIAAGTGLGEAILHWHDGRYLVAPGEGGHCDLAPRSAREIELLRHMKRAGGPVSCEMVISGRGFALIHDFLAAGKRHDDGDADPAPGITRRGLEGSCSVCVETLDLWVSLYGAEAGNLALKALAVNGVIVAGGIARKILPKMTDGTFFTAFCDKANFREMLAQIPIHIVVTDEAPLLGAAAEAARLLAV